MSDIAKVIVTPPETVDGWVALARYALKKATEVADKTQEGFDWDACGYGMGGWYEPQPPNLSHDEALAILRAGKDSVPYRTWIRVKDVLAGKDDNVDSDDYGWQASSQSC